MTGSTGATVLCINAGSSSLKAALADEQGITRRLELDLEGPEGLSPAVDRAVSELLGSEPRPIAVGHRVVHGGADLTEPTVVSDDVLARLRALTPLAPLHQAAAIATIEQTRIRLPDVPQVACFDTAFHRRLPASAQRLPLPERYWAAGIRRYGFHGLSYEYVVGRLGRRLGHRAVVAHLGSGSSLVALLDGMPVDTTMSLTPGGGLVMATRSGDLDPGVVLALLRLDGDPEAVARVLEHESGILGISGRTADVRTLIEVSTDDDAARRAIDAFVASAARHIAGATTVLGGLETLVFTGGIGAGSPLIRREITRRLAHLGVVVDQPANDRGSDVVSPSNASCSVLVLVTDEESVIAEQTLRTIRDVGRSP